MSVNTPTELDIYRKHYCLTELRQSVVLRHRAGFQQFSTFQLGRDWPP
ncbi:MAG: hypothetical protein WD274_13560 [Acidimicrobiia bacterium]